MSNSGDAVDVCTFKSKRVKSSFDRNKHVDRIQFLIKASELFAKDNLNLSRTYIKELKDIANKHLIRLNKSMKRKFCKGCNTLLTEDNKIINHENDWTVITCCICTRTRRIKS